MLNLNLEQLCVNFWCRCFLALIFQLSPVDLLLVGARQIIQRQWKINNKLQLCAEVDVDFMVHQLLKDYVQSQDSGRLPSNSTQEKAISEKLRECVKSVNTNAELVAQIEEQLCSTGSGSMSSSNASSTNGLSEMMETCTTAPSPAPMIDVEVTSTVAPPKKANRCHMCNKRVSLVVVVDYIVENIVMIKHTNVHLIIKQWNVKNFAKIIQSLSQIRFNESKMLKSQRFVHQKNNKTGPKFTKLILEFKKKFQMNPNLE
uniref:Uncharacterized protein n=1 Tax=Panagrolaimus sp. JU765 TaxID=591449 RepID=A0AC34RGA9_9BILA